MGVGSSEYVLLWRKPPTDNSDGYADVPVAKAKADYSLTRWQIDAHGLWRSDGNRPLLPEELDGLPHAQIFRWFRDFYTSAVYDYEHHVQLGEHLEQTGRLPSGFMLLQPPSTHPATWTDVARMRTLNMLQERKGQQQHLCLARGSLVLTRNGYKPIQEVSVGEDVLTYKGRWRQVLAVQKAGVRSAVTLQAHGVPGLTLTLDHKVWTRKSNWERERDGAERTEPTWLPASETVRGYVNLKLPPAEPPSVSDKTYWWAVGRWLADGHIDKRGCAIISVGRPLSGTTSPRKSAASVATPPHEGTALQVVLRDPGYELRRTL
jgi:hypothetical protein